MLNRQLAFDDAVNGLLEQGAWAYDEKSFMCLYRGPNNTRCAVGMLIPDHLYRPGWNGATAASPEVTDMIDPKYGLIDRELDDHVFLGELQCELHDQFSTKPFGAFLVIEEARRFAYEHHLSMENIYVEAAS